MKFNPCEKLMALSDRLRNLFPGNDFYLVGGSVRDEFLGVDGQDYDITGDLPSEQITKAFGGQCEQKLGTCFFAFEGMDYEYTPFRTEASYDGRRPGEVSFGATLEQDALRRDFTINALYIRLGTWEVIDVVKGVKDIEGKIIRANGSPEARFSEDYVRILRAIRLSAKTGFKIEERTYEAMVKNAGNLGKISTYRVSSELGKCIKDGNTRIRFLMNLDSFWNRISEKARKELLDAGYDFSDSAMFFLSVGGTEQDNMDAFLLKCIRYRTNEAIRFSPLSEEGRFGVVCYENFIGQYPDGINKSNFDKFLFLMRRQAFGQDMSMFFFLNNVYHGTDWKEMTERYEKALFSNKIVNNSQVPKDITQKFVENAVDKSTIQADIMKYYGIK